VIDNSRTVADVAQLRCRRADSGQLGQGLSGAVCREEPEL